MTKRYNSAISASRACATTRGFGVHIKGVGTFSSGATRALGHACGAGKTVALSTAAACAARAGGIIDAAMKGGFSAVTNIKAVRRGEKSGWNAAGSIAKDTAGGALSGAGSAAAATATGGLVAAGIAGTAVAGTLIGTVCTVGAPVVVAIAVGYGLDKAWAALCN